MPEGKIALRQLLCLLFAALLSPTVRVLPGRTAAAAGFTVAGVYEPTGARQDELEQVCRYYFRSADEWRTLL